MREVAYKNPSLNIYIYQELWLAKKEITGAVKIHLKTIGDFDLSSKDIWEPYVCVSIYIYS